MTLKTALLLFTALGSAQQAFAEDTAPAPHPSEETSGDIVVTAQRRQGSAQSIPMAIQVLSGTEIQKRNIATLDQIAVLTPGLKVDNNAGRGYVFIRGIGTDSVGIGVDPSVATYVDGVYNSRGNSVFGALWDLDHVEVLKGPQGTLYGRNATGGAILTVTKQPTLGKYEGYGLASYGNFNRKRVEAAVNVPIGQIAALRVSGVYTADDGYMHNLYTNQTVGGQNIKGGRATLLVEPADGLKISLTGSIIDQHGSKGTTFKLDTSQPSPTLAKYPSATVPSGPYDVNYNLPNNAELNARSTALTISYDLGPVSMKSVTGYNYTETNRVLDFDATQAQVNETYKGLETSKAFTQSIQFNNQVPGRFNWMVGGDYMHEDLAADIRSRFAPGTPDRILLASNSVSAMSAFVDLNYEIVPKLKLLAGVRYSHEVKNFFFNTPSRGSWDQPTPKFGLEYAFNRDVMLYATATQGFKSGGFNSSAVQPPFNPEKIWSYEGGIKSSWLKNTVTANLSAFYYDYTNLQVTQLPANGTVPITTNAGSATIKGLDLELSWHPTRAFHIGINGTALDSKYGNLALQNVSLAGSPFVSVNGFQMARAPKLSGSIDTAYTWDLKGSTLTLGADMRYTSRTYFSPFMTKFVSQSAFALVNARLTWAVQKVEVSAFVNNLTNKFYVITAQTYPTSIGTSYLPAEPRSFGASIKYSF
ncbi:TonB-dependent receptor [Novosphingobium rosa]|uniref:TonB-dependent receptor n=1 Tax=Novosphingobium rosa TaxID=76978 RepID=UPI0024800062|nr:TonB-dependent receptor [Novosphingobium rosa]